MRFVAALPLIACAAAAGNTVVLHTSGAISSVFVREEHDCIAGKAEACSTVGSFLFEGKSVTKDDVRATHFFERGCTLGDPAGCGALGFMLANGRRRNVVRAVELYRFACNHDDGPACQNLGEHYEYGDGVPKDREKAAALYAKACTCGAVPCVTVNEVPWPFVTRPAAPYP